MDQDETGMELGPRGHIVLGGDPAPPPQKRGTAPPIFDPCPFWPNGWMDYDATWYGGRPHPRRYCVRWRPKKNRRGTAPNFRSKSVLAKRSPISATAEHLLILSAMVTSCSVFWQASRRFITHLQMVQKWLKNMTWGTMTFLVLLLFETFMHSTHHNS